MSKQKSSRTQEIPFLSSIFSEEKRASIVGEREMEVTPLDDSELVARDTRNATKLAAVSAWLRDSTAWMEAAVYMDDLSKRSAPDGEPIDHHRANVAHVCAGYAYELLMKSIAKADDVPIDPTHSVRSTFEQLGKQRQSEIQLVTAAQGVADVGKFLDDVDKRLCDKNRKYSMFKRDMWSAGGLSFHFSGPGSIPEFARIHREIAGVGRAALEEWWGIRSREHAAIRSSLRKKS